MRLLKNDGKVKERESRHLLLTNSVLVTKVCPELQKYLVIWQNMGILSSSPILMEYHITYLLQI